MKILDKNGNIPFLATILASPVPRTNVYVIVKLDVIFTVVVL
jgi:hypothetical protein